MDLLDKDKILQLIDDTREDFELEIHQQLDSTNSYLLTQQLTDKVKICLAESQTAGRGRHGKGWHSPKDANIYLSFAHRLKIDISSLSGFSLVIGITLVETLQKYCKDLIKLKWPNDLLVNGKKLSGILVEIKNESKGSYKLITGIGINIDMPENTADFIDQPSISLSQCRPLTELSRNALAADIINNIQDKVNLFEQRGFVPFHHKWNKLDIWYGQQVVIEIGNNKMLGIHRGIDFSGALILDQEGKLSSWNSGEVSLRGTN